MYIAMRGTVETELRPNKTIQRTIRIDPDLDQQLSASKPDSLDQDPFSQAAVPELNRNISSMSGKSYIENT